MNLQLSYTCMFSDMIKLYYVARRHIRIYKEQMSWRVLALDQEKCCLLVAIDVCVAKHTSLVDQLFALDERLARFPSDDPWVLLDYLQNNSSAPLVADVKESRQGIDDMRQRLRELAVSSLSMHMALARYRADEATLARHCTTAATFASGFLERPELHWSDMGNDYDLRRARFCREIDAINLLCDKYANIDYSYA